MHWKLVGEALNDSHFPLLNGFWHFSFSTEHKSVHRVNLKLKSNEPVEIEVGFCSDKPLNVKEKMSLQVKDNQQSNTTIEVTGEAYQPIVSLDHISRSLQDIDHEDEKEGMA